MNFRPWGVILAGGEGNRLRPLSRFISGDNRPKQFCTLLGSGSLLARTRERLAQAISPNRTVFAVVKEHERFYRPELADVDESRIVVQPANRGTTAAILYSLLRLTRFEKDPVTAFFPADHHFTDEMQFAHAVDGAFEIVEKHPDLLVLLGARAETAEVEYGWIEPGQLVENDCGGSLAVFRVNRFWEKPSGATAQALFRRGCLWNTFVIAGRARVFLEALESTIPETLNAFRTVAAPRLRIEEEAMRATALYEAIPASDFSREVLTKCPERLSVLRMDGAGWGDLGTPEGVLNAMRKAAAASVPATANAFSLWLAAYGYRLEELCRQTGGPNESIF
jgi:mannose-1-phosphate guanylyltransferase